MHHGECNTLDLGRRIPVQIRTFLATSLRLTQPLRTEVELSLLGYRVGVRSSGTFASNIRPFANPILHHRRRAADTAGIEHLQENALYFIGVTSVEPAFEDWAGAAGFLDGKVHHVGPVIPGGVELGGVGGLARIGGIPVFVGEFIGFGGAVGVGDGADAGGAFG